VEIRPIEPADWPGVWQIWKSVVTTGETYDYPPESTEADAREHWLPAPPAQVWVAVDGDTVLGTYKITSNRLGLGDHVANGSYMVAPQSRGQGVGRALGEHSLDAARAAGFTAMQFNAVVSTNTGALRLWRALGFIIVGTIPNGFRHSKLGLVDFHIMHRFL
jgi:L-amino acid N-acyltransferase YncA